MKIEYILAIDTSCDETSVAVVDSEFKILSNTIYSQIKTHKEFGGVIPIVAKLNHQKKIDFAVKKALQKAKKDISQINYIAVTIAPGLAVALEVGIKKAKELASQLKKPLFSINHMEGHLLSSFDMKRDFNFDNFKTLGVLLSGGHTEFVEVSNLFQYKKIGETMDDAIGECLDKCGRMMGLGYPAGAIVAKFAKIGRKYKIFVKNINDVKAVSIKTEYGELKLPIPMVNSKDYNLSYSGLKTAFSTLLKKLGELDMNKICILSALIEEAAFLQIEYKLKAILEKNDYKEIWLGGGVIANSRIRSKIRAIAKIYNISVYSPKSKKLFGDNAAMIGIVAAFKLKYQESNIFKIIYSEIDRDPNLSL